jgi:formylmethanofuran dehydrogenase subunit E
MKQMTEIAIEVAELRAENKVLKSVNDSLIQALHKPIVVRGGDSENQFVQHVGKYFDYKNVNTTPNTPTELLPAEGSAKSVCGEKPAHNWIQLANDDIICTECGMQLRASLKLWLNI